MMEASTMIALIHQMHLIAFLSHTHGQRLPVVAHPQKSM
jgi:hypothetical protein